MRQLCLADGRRALGPPVGGWRHAMRTRLFARAEARAAQHVPDAERAAAAPAPSQAPQLRPQPVRPQPGYAKVRARMRCSDQSGPVAAVGVDGAHAAIRRRGLIAALPCANGSAARNARPEAAKRRARCSTRRLARIAGAETAVTRGMRHDRYLASHRSTGLNEMQCVRLA